MTTPTDWDLGRPDMVQAEVAPAAHVAFLEGPADDGHGNVYFTDIINNRILRLDTQTGQYIVWRADSGRANGLLFDPQGRLVACEGNEFGPGGRRRITRTNVETGELEILTDHFQGVPYNSPNDLAITSDGRIFFTDPCYGDRSSMFLQHESVYRLDPDGLLEFVITQPMIDRPNGIALSPDEQTLYIVDSCPTPGGNRKIWAFDLTPVGRVQNQRLVCDFAPGRGGDGMAVDIEGNLYIAAGIAHSRHENETEDVAPGIYVVTPEGKRLGRIPIPEDVITNVTFGGEDLRTLYVTAGRTLYTTRTAIPGFVIHRR